jgi:DNA-binding protein HU-beta
MNRKELIDAVAAKTEMKKVDVERVIEGTISAITEELANGGSVALTGFGTFATSERGERTGRNPSTGAEMKIAASRVAKFKVGSALKSAVKK